MVVYEFALRCAEDAAERKAAAGYSERQGDDLMDFSWYGYWARQYEEPPEEMWDYGEDEDDDA